MNRNLASALESHKDILEKEKKGLDYNIEKLRSFISSDKFNTLSDETKTNLRDQFEIMVRYSSVLGKRIVVECNEEHLTDHHKPKDIFQKYDRLPKTIEAVQFTDENKNKIFNSLTGQFAADFEDGKPIIKVTTVHGDVAVVRLGGWIVKEHELGNYYLIEDDIFSEGYTRNHEVNKNG